MTISTTSAQLAAQSFALGAAVQSQRPHATPRRIETADLVDLASKPEPAAKVNPIGPARESQSAAATVKHEAPSAWTDARPARPGSRLDIKV